MNVGEYGNTFRINVGEDISSNTNILTLTSPIPVYSNNTIGTENGLSVGTIDIDIGGETFKANEYIEYTIKEGDIFISGTWKARLFSQNPSQTECKITDNNIFFTIDP